MQSNFGKKQQKKSSGKSRFSSLRPEDQALWEEVAKSIRPLRMSTSITHVENSPVELNSMQLNSEDASPLKLNRSKSAVADSYQAATTIANKGKSEIRPIDRKTHRKIAKGKLDIDARLDLHGLNQNEAHTLLLRFLQSSQFRGLRHVLIITGKGSSPQSDGILRQLVPHWLSTPAFRIYISAINDAARHHGGHGAIYLKLRKLTA